MSEGSTSKAVIIAGVASALISGLAAFGGAYLGFTNKDKELDIQLINVGLSILRGEATGDKETEPARRFALRILREYAEVEIPDQEFETWAKKGTTPFKSTNQFPFISASYQNAWTYSDPGLSVPLRLRLASAVDEMVKENCIKQEDKQEVLQELIELTASSSGEPFVYNPIDNFKLSQKETSRCTVMWRFALLKFDLSRYVSER